MICTVGAVFIGEDITDGTAACNGSDVGSSRNALGLISNSLLAIIRHNRHQTRSSLSRINHITHTRYRFRHILKLALPTVAHTYHNLYVFRDGRTNGVFISQCQSIGAYTLAVIRQDVGSKGGRGGAVGRHRVGGRTSGGATIAPGQGIVGRGVGDVGSHSIRIA